MWESGSDPNMPLEGNLSTQQQGSPRFGKTPDRRLMRPAPRPRPPESQARRRFAPGEPRRPEPPVRGQKPLVSPKVKNFAARPINADRPLPSATLRLGETRHDRRQTGQGDRRRRTLEMSAVLENRSLRAVPGQANPIQRRERPQRKFAAPNAKGLPPRTRTRSGAALLYGTRLLILGIGVGVLAGTILSVWDPARYFTAGASQSETPEQVAVSSPQPELPTLSLSQEIPALKNDVQTLVAQQPQLTPGLMVVDLDSGAYLNVNAGASFPAASTIKLPVLVAFFQDLDAGKIQLDEMLTMRPDLIATESGDMQYQPPGSQFTALETATKMMTISDNTATNMLIDRLGGKEALNQRFQSWGLMSTGIQNLLPDVEGTNITSPQDLVTVLGLVSNGKLLSMRSRDRLLDIMRRTVTNSLLPSGLGEGATIAHKTGNIGSMTGDVGLVDMPTGKRYLIAALIKRPRNDEHGEALIQQFSRTTYQYFSQANSTSGNTAPLRTRVAQP
jgi:beta-lactamase class A